MPVTLKQVVDHVAAMEPETDRRKISATVRETIAALGLLVNASNDEVYNPAPAPSVNSRCYCGSPNHSYGACAKGYRRRR
jgi:hypothetical protein